MSEMYVLIKNGHFHRPGHKGYTSSILDAGMWSRDYAEHYVSDSRSEVKFDAALRHMTDKQQEMFACHRALSALGAPVKVAEALPELMEAAEEALKDYCVLQGNIAASMKVDPNWEGVWDELSKRKKALRSVLSKLKAQP